MDPGYIPRRYLVRASAFIVVLMLLTPTGFSALTHDSNEVTEFKRGTVTKAADSMTVVGIQGFHFQGEGAEKKPARLAAFGPRGEPRWVYDGSEVGARWFYDVDPLPDGNLLVTATNPDGTVVLALDPTTQEPVWVERLPYTDTHDVDQLDEHRLVIAIMRAYDETTDTNNDGILIYNRTTGEEEWRWFVRDHYPELLDQDVSIGRGGVRVDDWTHLNDVDRIAPGRYLVSLRNFDQVVVVDQDTGEIELQLGENNRHDIIKEQHNPDYLESEAGQPTILVADSENDRVVEYELTDHGWERTWELSGQLSWPRDADRLPNGNTLVTDTLNHRIIEVAPDGEIVWEVYAPWGPYDTERVEHGPGSKGPTMADQNATGNVTLHGGAGLVPGTGDRVSFEQRLVATFTGTPLEGPATEFATRWAHTTPWIYPVWMTGWDFAFLVAAALVAIVWAVAEVVVSRDRIAARLRRLTT